LSSLKKLPALPKCLWTISKDGVDYGPYRSAEILEEIAKSEVRDDTELFEQNTGLKIRTSEIRAFAKACREASTERAAHQLAMESEAHYSEIRQHQRLKPILFTLIVVLCGVGVWQFRSLGLGTSEYETAFASPLSAVPSLSTNYTALAPPRKDSIEKNTKKDSAAKTNTRRRRRKRRAKRKRNGSSPPIAVAAPADPAGSTQEFDFSDDDEAGADGKSPSGPLPLTPVEIQRVQSLLRPRFRQCFRKLVDRLPPGTYGVRTVLQRSGKFSTPVLQPRLESGSQLQSCLTMVTQIVKSRPFSGPSQTVQGRYSIGEP